MASAPELRVRRVKHAVVSGVVLTSLFLLLLLAPTRMLGWAGLGFGSLDVPAAPAVAAVDEPVAVAVATIPPPLIEPMTFPAYAEWSDLEAACSDCDWSVSYGIGGNLDAVDNETLSRLEKASGFAPGAGASSGNRTASAPSWSSSGGGMGGGGGAAGSATEEASTALAAEESTSESATDDSRTTAASVATAASPESAREAGDGESSSDGSSAPDVTDTAAAASSTPDLILGLAAPSSSSVGALPQDVVQALVESPVGSETVHSAGEPEIMSAALNLDETPAAFGGDAGAQQELVPEPMLLVLMGLGLSVGVARRRRAAAR